MQGESTRCLDQFHGASGFADRFRAAPGRDLSSAPRGKRAAACRHLSSVLREESARVCRQRPGSFLAGWQQGGLGASCLIPLGQPPPPASAFRWLRAARRAEGFLIHLPAACATLRLSGQRRGDAIRGLAGFPGREFEPCHAGRERVIGIQLRRCRQAG